MFQELTQTLFKVRRVPDQATARASSNPLTRAYVVPVTAIRYHFHVVRHAHPSGIFPHVVVRV